MSVRLIARSVVFLATSVVSGACYADEEEFNFGISVAGLVRHFSEEFADVGQGIRFASCYSLDPDVGGPAEAILVFLPKGAQSRRPDFDAVFFWIGSDETGRFMPDYGNIEFLKDDIEVSAAQGGLWIDEAMERTIIPLLSTHPHIAHSANEIFERPRGRCRYSPHWDYINPKPRHRPKIKPEWFASK